MPYIITTSKYPSHIQNKVGERYLEVIQKYPPDERLGNPVVPGAVKATQEGIKIMAIMEIPEEKFVEAYKRTGEVVAQYFDIEGFEASVDTYLTLEEAMATVGMSVPE
jgi:hypothetical protein